MKGRTVIRVLNLDIYWPGCLPIPPTSFLFCCLACPALNYFKMWPFVSRPPPPPRVQSDTILPLRPQDDNLIYRSIFINVLMRFDSQLDQDKLCVSLERLLRRDGWNKFGARLRLNVRQMNSPTTSKCLHSHRAIESSSIIYQWNSVKSDQAFIILTLIITSVSMSTSWHLRYPKPQRSLQFIATQEISKALWIPPMGPRHCKTT